MCLLPINVRKGTVDYRSKRIVFGPIDPSLIAIPYQAHPGYALVEVQIQQRKLLLLLDRVLAIWSSSKAAVWPACRASTRSLLLPSFKRSFFRGSQTTSRFTCGFRRSCNQAADVPSSKVSHRVPCNPRRNSTIVA